MREPDIHFRKAADGTEVMHRQVSCGAKSQYRSEREAWYALRKQLREGVRKPNAGIYQCAVCWMWHIGRKPS